MKPLRFGVRAVLTAIIVGGLVGRLPGQSPVARTLQPYVDKGWLAGAVTVVADKDKVLAVDAVGFADIENSKMMAPDTVFWIASQSKPITAAGLMLLVDEGKIDLDDPVEKYLPDFKNLWVEVEKDKDHILLKRPRRPITVRDVLSHMSGMVYRSEMERPTLDGLSLNDAVRSYAITPLHSQPGTKYEYSNAGINTAGRIIEVVSGMPFDDFMRRRLFVPLEMNETTFWPSAEQMKRLAKTYRPKADKNGIEEGKTPFLTYPYDQASRHIMPAGGYFATADDVVRFCQMILAGGTYKGKRLLSEKAVRELTRRQTPDHVKTAYGLGFQVFDDAFGHGGALGTDMVINPSRGLITIFLVQHMGYPGEGARCRDAFRATAEAEYRPRPK